MKYIGSRYVPKFMGTYDASQIYEALCVVDNGSGTSYISKDIVPAGTPLTDISHWAVYGASSGAIINLQNQIDILDSSVSDLIKKVGSFATPQMYGAVGDGVTDDSQAFTDLLSENSFIFIPEGVYLITNTLSLHEHFIIGANDVNTTLRFDDCDALSVDRDTTIENLTIVCANAAQTHIGLNIYHSGGDTAPHINLKNVRLHYFEYGIRSVDASAWSCQFQNVRLGRNLKAIYIDALSNSSSAFCCTFINVMVHSETGEKALYLKNVSAAFIGCNFSCTSIESVYTNLSNIDFIGCSFEMDNVDSTVKNGSILRISGNIDFENCRFMDNFIASGTNYMIEDIHPEQTNRFTFKHCIKNSYTGSYLTKLFNPAFMNTSPRYGLVHASSNNFSIYDDVYAQMRKYIIENDNPIVLQENAIDIDKLEVMRIYMMRIGTSSVYEPAVMYNGSLVNMYDHSIVYLAPTP